ncbi:MAG: hypothetical protein IJ666_09025 [Ruminococcus sp.]|nr:hypothetical protein [Ruminococcus sp.]
MSENSENETEETTEIETEEVTETEELTETVTETYTTATTVTTVPIDTESLNTFTNTGTVFIYAILFTMLCKVVYKLFSIFF